MEKKILIVFVGLIISIPTVFAQTADDNIAFLKVQNQINDGNYYKALETLETISQSGRSSNFYLSYSASCYESTYEFNKAASSYKQLYSKTNSFDAMKKAADMEQFQENKQNVIAGDSLLRSKNFDIGKYKFKRDDSGLEYLILIAKDKTKDGFIIQIISLPDFVIKTTTLCDGKLDIESTDEPAYFFYGNYNYRFTGKYSVCNKEMPACTMAGFINKYFNTLTLLVFAYDCVLNDDGSHMLRKREADDRIKWIFSKVSDFNLK